MSELKIRALDPADGVRAVAVLMDAFAPDPWAQWCFFGEEPGYRDRLHGYLEVGHAWHTGLGFSLLGAYEGERLLAVAYVMEAGAEIPSGEEHALLPRMREACGDAATERFRRCNQATEAETADAPAHCIALIAVDSTRQSRGVGSRLMEGVLANAEADASSAGVVLETSNPRNLMFYHRHGFERVGRVHIDGLDGLDIHVLFRPDGGSIG